MFKPVTPRVSFPKLEEEILKFWQKEGIFKKSLERNKGKKGFVFYEGPPTANGKPGTHHVLARSFKDIICRYKTMQGFLVERKGGWDTHGLPVELEVEKQLGISGKQDILNLNWLMSQEHFSWSGQLLHGRFREMLLWLWAKG